MELFYNFVYNILHQCYNVPVDRLREMVAVRELTVSRSDD